ncbi:MAG: oxygen-dependent coproporphyrinogen oxidase [Planctomycetes bacterium]|nr:oxygen-dependent coproporphyrinogen oxidase [Planctomycetota bacterium]
MRRRMEEMVARTQDEVCALIEDLDGGHRFREDLWSRSEGGGGRTRVLENGRRFEKAGVNVSTVSGPMPEAIARAARGRGIALPEGEHHFWATGVSLVLHPSNPLAPTVHANYRYFEMESNTGDRLAWWFGGGTDLTPNYLFAEDARHFHGVLKERCDRHDRSFYPRFKKDCDDYFRIPHRGEARGLGGIFFDNLNDRDPELLFAFSADCAAGIVPAIEPIYRARLDLPFAERHRRWQQLRRGRYVEFNLVYDRGTTFGLRTGGRTESILMSLPLTARWEYDHEPEAGSPEAELLEILRHPRDWA